MTAIIGHTAARMAFLAADSRRRDHGTGKLTRQEKLHQWSTQVIVAQAGAGTGAADEVIQSIFRKRDQIGPSVADLGAALCEISPPLLAAAKAKWESEEKRIPHTRLILATVCANSGLGEIWTTDLFLGTTQRMSEFPNPYFAGSATPAIIEVGSFVNFTLRKTGIDPFPFDVWVAQTIAMLSQTHSADIFLPADIGRVKFDKETGEFQSEIVRDVMPGQPIRADYLATFEMNVEALK